LILELIFVFFVITPKASDHQYILYFLFNNLK